MERAIAALLQEWLANGLRGLVGSGGRCLARAATTRTRTYSLGWFSAGPARHATAAPMAASPITVRGSRGRVSDAAKVLERERMASSRRGEAHPHLTDPR